VGGVKLSVVIPAHDEAESIAQTVEGVRAALRTAGIDYEIVVIDDASTDGTLGIVQALAADGDVRAFRSHYPGGFGHAVRAGLDRFAGDAVVVLMADGSDDPRDVVLYYRVLEAGYDCAFGSRFMPGGGVVDYPRVKLVMNRIVNAGIRVLFRHGYNDTTNAFKAYKRDVIETIQPLFSQHFNLTVEMPLKAIIRGHTFAVVPTTWRNRTAGESKLAMREMGSRYLFIVLYAFLEAHLSRGDYRRHDAVEPIRPKAERGDLRLAEGPPR
jgi:dolichol-phosphate mannosyltransferase